MLFSEAKGALVRIYSLAITPYDRGRERSWKVVAGLFIDIAIGVLPIPMLDCCTLDLSVT